MASTTTAQPERGSHSKAPYAHAAAAQRALPEVEGGTYLAAAPLDEYVLHGGRGVIACLTTPLPVYDAPAGVPVAVMPGNPVHLPVIDRQPGWVRVLLPVQPNGTTGWVDAERVRFLTARYDLRLELTEEALYVRFCGRTIRRSPVAIRAGGCMVPYGRTFVLPGHSSAGMSLAAHHGDGGDIVRITAVQGRGALTVTASALAALAHVEPGSLVRIHH